MTTAALPTPRTPVPQSPPRGVGRRLVDRITYPAEHPISALLIYYTILVTGGALLIYFVPSAQGMISGERLGQIVGGKGGLFEPTARPAPGSALSWELTFDMALAMLGAFALMLPTSWVYMAERRKKGFDQAVVQTMVVLSVAVAGVVVIVRNSTALAFSLAGIVAAVRYRNTLSDTRDTLYIFTCIGVGLAAGVQALAAALVLSLIFNFTILAFWRGDYGMCELGRSPGYLLMGGGRTTEPAPAKSLPKKDKKKDFNAVLLVRTVNPEQARPAVDGLLAGQVSRFQLAEIEANSKGQGVLKYLVRLGKNADRGGLEDALLQRGAPHVIGARVH